MNKTRKRLISALLAVLMVFTSLNLDCINVRADSTTDETGAAEEAILTYEYNSSEKTATVTGCSNTDKTKIASIVIPNTVEDGNEKYTVKSIAAGVFSASTYTSLKEVAIQGKEVTIGDNAFGVDSEGATVGGFTVWCIPGSTAETYATTISATIKYLNESDAISLSYTNKQWSGRGSFAISATLKSSDITKYSHDVMFSIADDYKDYVYFKDTNGNAVNTACEAQGNLTFTDNTDGTTTVEAQVYVIDTAAMREKNKTDINVSVAVSSYSGLSAEAAVTIYRATSTLDSEIKVFEVMTKTDANGNTYKAATLYKDSEENTKNDSDGNPYVNLCVEDVTDEFNVAESDIQNLYIDKDYIFGIVPKTDGENSDSIKISVTNNDKIASPEGTKVSCYLDSKGQTGYVAGIVDSDGNVITGSNDIEYTYFSANNLGSTMLTLISSNTVLSRNINISVLSPATGLKLKVDGNDYTGNTLQGLTSDVYNLSHEFTPSDSTDTVTWTSSDASIAQITGTTMKFLKNGQATIKCTVSNSQNGKERTLTSSFGVIVVQKVAYSKIVFAKDSKKSETISSCDIEQGKKFQLIACDSKDDGQTIYNAPSGETPANERLTYTSNNTGIATVSSDGVITAGNTVGTTIITVKSESGKTASITVNVYVKAEKIASDTEFTVPMGQTRELEYSLSPATATEDVNWTSSAPGVCTAEDYKDANGKRYIKVTGITEGTAELTGKTKQSGATTIIKATVAKPVNTSTINLVPTGATAETDDSGNTVYNVAKGESFYVTPSLVSSDGTAVNDLTKWSVESSQNYCDVSTDAAGIITFKAKSTGKFYATYTAYGKTPEGEDFEKKATFYVNVYVPATDISISANGSNADEINIELGNTSQISAALTPSDSTDIIKWFTDNDNIDLSVNQTTSGAATVITANKVGTTVLTATADSGKTDTLKINVIVPAADLAFAQNGQNVTTVNVPLKGASTVNITMSNEDTTTDTTFTWTAAGNAAYIKIEPSSDGKSAQITGLAKGTQRITITSPSGKTASIEVNVVVPADEITLNSSEVKIYKGDASISVSALLSPSENTDVVTWSTDKDGIISFKEDTSNSTAVRKVIQVTGIEAGEVTLTATTVGGKTAGMKITVETRDVSGTTIDAIGDQTYTGAAIEPNIIVRRDNVTLNRNTDYTASYTNNVNAGTATVVVQGIGAYSGTASQTFKINPKAITSVQVSAVNAEGYDGKEHTPDVTVTDLINGTTKTLEKDKDYTIEYLNNVYLGTAQIKITGIGNYTDERTVNFQITARDISKAEEITVDDIAAVTYTGAEIKPSVVVKDGGTLLAADTDYRVTYSNNTNAGTAVATITGLGNYTGTITKEFNINKRSLSKAKFPELPNQVYTGDRYTFSSLSVTLGDRTLQLNNDFTASYSNNKYPGKVTVTITGINNYKSNAKGYFIILPAAPTNAKMASSTSNSIKLSWKKSTKVTGYYIYAFNQKKNKYVKVATTTKNSVTLKKLSSGTDYAYQIYSYVKVGKKVYKSTQFAAVTAGTKTKTPSIKKVSSQASGSAVLEWKAATGAASYQVYYATSKKGKYKLFGSVNGLSSNITGLKAGKKYYFKIRTVRNINGKDYYSSYSAVKSAKIKK